MTHRFLANLGVRGHAHLGRDLVGVILSALVITPHMHLRAERVLAEAHLAEVRARRQPELRLAQGAEHLAGSLGETEIRITVIELDRGRLERAYLPAKVFTAHAIVPLVQNSLRGDQYFGLFLDFGNDFDAFGWLASGCHGVFDLA